MSDLTFEDYDIKLYQSLFFLFKCDQTIDKVWKLYQSDKSNNFLLFHMILEIENFGEEYEKHFNCKNISEYKERINQIRYIVKPVFKEVDKWNLRQFRNNIVAHPWRDGGEFMSPDSDKYKIPKNQFEFLLLKNYINYIWSLIAAEFEKEFIAANEYMFTISEKPKREKDYSTVNSIQKELAKDVNLRCKEFKKKYHLKILLYEFDD